ncbi:MAG: hypothetical protein V7760_04170 [Marinobacter sp.]
MVQPDAALLTTNELEQLQDAGHGDGVSVLLMADTEQKHRVTD